MQRDLLVELLTAAACRPHRQCLLQARTVPHRTIRYASTSTPRKGSKPPPPTGSQELDPFKSATAHIPLHVGLDRNPESVSAISRIPIPKGEQGEKFTPSVLARPLGLLHPPRPGQNSPIDNRTISERHRDFTSVDKVMERRKIYLRTYLRPYFQEWKRANHHRGKSFVSNNRLFRKDKALYFPNIWGETLAKEGDGPDGGRNSTTTLMGKISIVGVQSGRWAEEQVDTFIGKTANPELQKIIADSGGRIQRADVNIQGDVLRLWLVKLYKSSLRRMIPEERWSRYFILKLPRDIRPGLTDEIRDSIGLLNSQVGYVYLLDRECRIRWAGSGDAWEGEVASLDAGVRRLLEEST